MFAQTDRSSITGMISDPAGAVVPGAVIEVRNVNTGAVFTGGSSATGNYTIPVPTGSYALNVTVSGFRKYVRQDIEVPVATAIRQDVTLEVGATSDVITVTGSAPLLKTESGDIGHNVHYGRANQLPVLTLGSNFGLGNVRNPLQIVNLLPGAQFANENILKINGLPSNSHAVRIEGQDATNGIWRQINQGNQSGVDAIEEVAIQTSNYAAEYGQAAGGYFNYTMKSGTNQYHGAAYDYMVNEALHAGTPNTPLNAAPGTPHNRNRQRRNDYGFTFGGPIWIPKVYDGQDTTFFFFNFEQFRETTFTSSSQATVPTPAYRAGNFATAMTGRQLSIAGQPAFDPLGNPVFENAIYDPATTRLHSSGFIVRDRFPGNVIPAGQIDPVTARIQALLPLPAGPNAGNLVNNYTVPGFSNFRHTTIPSIKLDHQISSTIKLSGFFNAIMTRSPNANGFTQVFTPVTPQDIFSTTSRVNFDQTVAPTVLLHLGIGLLTTRAPSIPTQTIDQERELGLVGFYADFFPNIGGLMGAAQRGGTTIPMGPGAFGNQIQYEYKPTANASLTWVKNSHSIKAGGEMVIDGMPQTGFNRANGLWAFASTQTQTPWQDGRSLNGSTGFNYASFFLGRANSLNVTKQADVRLGNHMLGFFAQDTWKVTRRLTLDYGLRYDYVTYLKEQYGRMQNAAFNTPNPTVGRNGAVIYEGFLPGRCQCNFGSNYKYSIGPRLGLAYQVTPKTVFRAGYGISYGTAPNNAQLILSVADFYTINSPAYGEPAAVFGDGNPYRAGNPFGNPEIEWPNFDPGKYPFRTIAGLPPQSPFIAIDRNAGRAPRIMQWSAGLQREVMRDLVVEAAYVANRGVWFTGPALADINYNGIRPQDLGRYGLDIGIAADRTLLTTRLDSPNVAARGLNRLPYAEFPASLNLTQSLRPYPHWNGVPSFLGPPLASTWYDALQAKATKRYSHGLDVQAAFTWQKELTNGINSDTSYVTNLPTNAPVSINDVYNRAQNKQLSAQGQPFQTVVSFNYTVPGFQATSAAMKTLSSVTRDWTLGGVLQYRSGTVIRVPASNNQLKNQLSLTSSPATFFGTATYWNRVPGQDFFVDGVDPDCGCFDPAKTQVLNAAAWTDAPGGTWGTSAPYYNDYRWQRQPSEALSLGRIFRMGPEGRYTLQVRAEFQNVMNRMFLSMPTATNPAAATTIDMGTGPRKGLLNGGFGFVNTINGAGSNPRRGQFVGRFQF